jgi:hypothetical protein
MRSKYTKGYIRKVREEKENLSIKQIMSKFNLSEGQVAYILYSDRFDKKPKPSREIEPEPRTFLVVMKELFEKIQKAL